MPFPILHIEIGSRLLRNFNFNEELFYIGCVAPDAIHIRTEATKEDKRLIHMYHEKTIEGRFNQIHVLKERYRNDDSFLSGCMKHLAADYLKLYFLNWYYKYQYEIERSQQEKDKLYYYENQYIENYLYNRNCKKYQKILNSMKNVEIPSYMNLLTSDEISAWIEKIEKKDYTNNREERMTYFTIERIDRFIDYTTDVINKCFSDNFLEGLKYLKQKYKESCIVYST